MMTRVQTNQTFMDPLKHIFSRFIDFLPNLIGAIALALLGWLLAYILRIVICRLLQYVLERLSRSKYFTARMQTQRLYQAMPRILSSIFYWLVLIFFLVAAVEVLGLQVISDMLHQAVRYIPHVFVATLIIFTGIFLGDFLRNWVMKIALRARVSRADLLGRTVQVLLVIISVLLAIDQLGIDSRVLILLLVITLGSIFAGAALAFGLGAGPMVSNIIACHYLQRHYEVGQRIRIGQMEGSITAITRTAVILETTEGCVQIPARRFSEEISIQIEERTD